MKQSLAEWAHQSLDFITANFHDDERFWCLNQAYLSAIIYAIISKHIKSNSIIEAFSISQIIKLERIIEIYYRWSIN